MNLTFGSGYFPHLCCLSTFKTSIGLFESVQYVFCHTNSRLDSESPSVPKFNITKLSAKWEFLTIAVSVLLTWYTTAQGQDTSDENARFHFKAGTSYYETGDYELALREFKRSYQLSNHPELQYNISLTHEKLGNLEEAIFALNRYLLEGSDIPNRRTLEMRLTNLKKRLEQERQTIQTKPTKSQPEQESAATTEKMQPAAKVKKVQPDTKAESTHIQTTEERLNNGVQQSERNELANAPANSSDGPVLFGLPLEIVASFVLAGVGAVTFIGFGALSVAENNRLESKCLDNSGAGLCGEDDISTLETMSLVADIGLVIGLVSGAIGVTLFLTREEKNRPYTSWKIAPRLSIDQLGAFTQMRF